ncbi:MAG: hypothetical protein ACRD2A_25330, partial [Vicinamibacterales bacterium]
GYATPDHVAALGANAPTRHHRGSFARVRQLLCAFGDGPEQPDFPAFVGTLLPPAEAPGSVQSLS